MQKPPPEDRVKYEVITTGAFFDAVENTYKAYYWKDGERFSLSSGTSRQAFVYGMEKIGNDLYIAGGYEGMHAVAGKILLPCYWHNGLKKDLPIDGMSIMERYSASGIRWFNNALYILGEVDMRPIMWKIKFDQIIRIDFPVSNISVTAMRRGSNLELYDGKLYVAGNEKRRAGDGFVFNTGYWTINANHAIDFHIMEDDFLYALSFALSVSSKGVYITGSIAKVIRNIPNLLFGDRREK